MAEHSRISRPGLIIGLGLIAAAAVISWDAARMQVPPSYARVGPQIFPYIISVCMALLGLYFAWDAGSPNGRHDVKAEDARTDWIAVAVISAGLVIHLNILKPLGFIPAAILLFMCVSFAFGSRNYLRDVIVAVVLAVVSYAGFNYGLGLQLPAGPLHGVI